MNKILTNAIDSAVRTGRLVRIHRRFDSGSECGYVLATGPKFFLLSLIGENIRFNGFQVLRRADVSRCAISQKHARFIEKALRLRGEHRPPKPPVSVATLLALMKSAALAYPLVTIHIEEINPDVCYVGKVISVSRTSVTLREIDTDAEWEKGETEYQLRDITRVDFGGGYEEALAVAAKGT